MELDIEYDFSIIGISTVAGDHQMAFYLNKYLGTNFSRLKKDLDVQGKSEDHISYFPIFLHEDVQGYEEWFLIGNKYNTENKFFEKDEKISHNLFFNNDQSTQITKYFIPEKKEVNYILRLDHIDNKGKLEKLVKTIRLLPVVTTAFSIEYNTLRSKQNLIF